MINKIQKTTVWFDNKTRPFGYYNDQNNTYMEAGEVKQALEMLVDKLNSVIEAVNSIQQKKTK